MTHFRAGAKNTPILVLITLCTAALLFVPAGLRADDDIRRTTSSGTTWRWPRCRWTPGRRPGWTI